MGGGLDGIGLATDQSTNQLNAGSQYLFNSDSTYQLNSSSHLNNTNNNPSSKINKNSSTQNIGLNILNHSKLAGSVQVIHSLFIKTKKNNNSLMF